MAGLVVSIKSMQRGTVSVTSSGSGTATISSVNMAKTELRFLGFTVSGTTDTPTRYTGRIELTNATTVTVYRTDTSSDTLTAGFEAEEKY